MGKPKKGMRVRHNSTGQEGVITAVIRGVVHVVFPGGKKGSAYAGSFSKAPSKGGCLKAAIPLGAILIEGVRQLVS